MSQLRRDPIIGRWIIVNTDEPSGPDAFEKETRIKKAGVCPFCYGNEHMTPPEIYAHRQGPSVPNTSGWLTRVVPNKFPALQIEGDLNRRGIGVFDMSNGVGAHEVIIENPDHNKDISDLKDTDVENIIFAYRSRSVDLKRDTRFKYILIFKNYGLSAGASLEHPHSQLIALPVVPKRAQEELRGAEQYYEYKDRCIFCDMIWQEIQDDERIICENKSFIAFQPFVPIFPFETWIIPRVHHSDFELIQNDTVADLARIMRETFLRLKKVLHDPSYNFIIHTAPLEAQEREDYHWHIEIMPKLVRLAGFEWGSGFYINPTPPEVSAKYLKEAEI